MIGLFLETDQKEEKMYKKIEEVEQRIDWNYKAAKEFEKLLKKDISDEEKLEIIHFLGVFYSEFVTGVYSSCFLEKNIFEIGRKIEYQRTAKPIQERTLIVMTKAADTGGHTVIANNWIAWDVGYKYSIVFTDMNMENVPDFLKSAVKTSGGEMYFLKGTYIEKAKQLLCISQRFSKVILLQHMYDIIPNLAYSNLKWNIPIYMYNHANFKFSYGYAVADVVISLCNYDVEKAITYRGVNKSRNVFLQFPNGENIIGNMGDGFKRNGRKKNIVNKYQIDPQKKLVVSMGDDFKFNDIIDCSFVKFVQNLIIQRNGDTQYLVIGADPDKEKWKLLLKNTDGLARAVGFIPREEAYELIHAADLYIVSFPMAASGLTTAEIFSVPYLMLAVTERGVENYAENVTRSLEELQQKANEVLDGEVEKYRGHYFEKILDQDEWCKAWYAISNQVKSHKNRTFKPKRNIQKEEIVNCQLMQERANQTVKIMLEQHKLTPIIASKLFEICEKYDLHFMPDNFVIAEWNINQKRLFMATYANKWLQLKLKEVSLADYLQAMNIYKIAIYGMGQMGLNLYEELKNTDVSVECFIDRQANRLEAPILIIGPDQIPVQSQCIINTAFLSAEQLRKSYTCLPGNYKILSLFEIIDLEYNKVK